MSVIVLVIVAVHVNVNGNGNATVIVIRPVDGARNRRVDDAAAMLSFQKLDVYQRSIEFLAFARRLLQRIPKGMPTWCPVRNATDVPACTAALLERVVPMLTKMINP